MPSMHSFLERAGTAIVGAACGRRPTTQVQAVCRMETLVQTSNQHMPDSLDLVTFACRAWPAQTTLRNRDEEKKDETV